MNRLSLDEEFAALRECVESEDDADKLAGLKRFLGHKSNLVVERAATRTAELEFSALADDLSKAFDRLLVKPVKTDPGCIAKTAICAALRRLEHSDVKFFRNHLEYTQFEPYFGGLEDKAGKLRAECILALVERRAPGFLEAAVDLSFDPIPAARGGAIRGIANSARPEAALLLRMKALAGDESPEVLGEALSGLVHLGASEVQFVGRFLDAEDAAIVGEAAFALAESRRADAVPLIVARWKRSPHGPLSQTLFTALALCRHDDAVEALCDIAATQELDIAKQAMSALQQAQNQKLVRERLSQKLEGSVQSERVRFFHDALGD